MKKTLLSIFVTISGLLATNAQTITSQDFNSLSVGDIGTTIDGLSLGQGNFLTVASGTNAANSNFQIVSDNVAHANVFQITGQSDATGNRYAVNTDIATIWPTRTSGNDIIEIEFDFNPGPATASKNSFRVLLYDATTTKIIAGLLIAMDTKLVTGAIYANPGTAGNYGYGFSPAPPALAPDTWVRMGMSFNKTTGLVTWKGPGFNETYTGDCIGIDPDGAYFFVSAGASNTVAAVGKFDNFTVKATNTDTLLGTSSNELIASKISVYPNPATDVVTVSNNGTVLINTVSITDINGRTVKSLNMDSAAESKITISDLNTGIYFMNITTNEGSITKKVIKK